MLEVRSRAGWRARQAPLGAGPEVYRAAGAPRPRLGRFAADAHATGKPQAAAVQAWSLSKAALAGVLAAAALAAAPGPSAGAAEVFAAGGQPLFDAAAYAGRWYEVASLKKGFAGEGQADCHCTQGSEWTRQAPQPSQLSAM